MSVALATHLRPLRTWLDDPDIGEISINQPGEIWVDRHGVSERIAVPELDYQHLSFVAELVATYTQQKVSAATPLLSAKTPEGYRIQVVLPPAVPQNTIAVSIRRPALLELSLDNYAELGRLAIQGATATHSVNQALHELRDHGRILDCLKLAVKERKNIIVAGGTYTGKTTFMNALIREIPINERLIMIEDVEELKPPHPNQLRLLYSRNSQGQANVDATMLLEACLRLRPDRILLGELRGAEAFAYLRSARSGHSGSITSVHADSPAKVLDQLVLMCLQAGLKMEKKDLLAFVTSVVDMIVQWRYDQGQRFIQEIWINESA